MNVPTPMNTTARDDRFDRGLERLLDGDPAGIDEIEPELQDIAVHMVQLANEAGWVGSDPGAITSVPVPWWQRGQKIVNAVAAVLVIGMLATMVAFALQVWGITENQFGAGPTSEPAAEIGPGMCRRTARTDAEIAAIVRKSETEIAPFAGPGIEADAVSSALQLTRDWNACLQGQQWTRAMAYESEFFIWSVGQVQYPDGVGAATDAQIATRLADAHGFIAPIQTLDGTDLSVYASENYRVDTSRDRWEMIGLDLWVVPMDEYNEWIQWPTVVTVEWDGVQWVVVSATSDGVPESPYRRDDTRQNPGPVATPQ